MFYGFSIYPSQTGSGPPQIPIGNNTGSLPDLTNFQANFQFSPPMGTLDPDDHNSPTYSSGVIKLFICVLVFCFTDSSFLFFFQRTFADFARVKKTRLRIF